MPPRPLFPRALPASVTKTLNSTTICHQPLSSPPPLRSQCLLLSPHNRRIFHTSPHSHQNAEPDLNSSNPPPPPPPGEPHPDHKPIDAAKTHYEALLVSPDSPASTIKSSFYKLSKRHHPDHNPTDRSAPRRFMKLSEAYSILSSPERRAAYDRSIERIHGHVHQHKHRGSYHGGSHHGHGATAAGCGSGGGTRYAGGRPASGLSKKRGHFQGPPPSFFRSGGYGTHGHTRHAEHERSTQTQGGKWRGNAAPGPGEPGYNTYTASSSGGGGGGKDKNSHSSSFYHHPHHNAHPHRNHYGARHFDSHAHERTHASIQARFDERQRAAIPARDESGHLVTDFMLMLGVISLSVGLPLAMQAMFGEDEADRRIKERKGFKW